MRRVFALLMLAVMGIADLAVAQKLTETKNLPLPPALWADGAPAVSGQLLARVAMRKVKYARVLSQRALALPAEAAAWPASEVPGGVRRLELAGPGSGLKLSDFNEARLDYLTDSPDQPGCLGFVAELSGGGERAVFVSDPLETVDHLTPRWADGSGGPDGEGGPGRESIPVASAAWTGKGLRYQLSRLLDRAPDDLWRTSQDGLSTFLQRRFNKPVQDLGAIDVVLLRGQEVQVNAVVALDPGSRARTVLDWYALPKRTFDLGDGRTILRLYVGRHLREIAPGRSGVTLKELSLMFFRQNVGDVARERNVEKILFVPTGLDEALLAQGLPRNLPARAREVFAGRGELAANLQALGQAPWKDMALSRFDVLQSPQNLQAGQPFRQALEASRLANVAPRRDVPAIVAAMAERCASFGASCDVEALDGLISQAPLWNLDFQALAVAGGGAGAAVHPALTGNLFTSGGRLSFASAQDGLLVESASGALVLETGAAFVPEPGTRYSLWLELGRERQGLSSVTAEAYGPDKSVRVAVKPGVPTVFPELPARVDGVRLLFTPASQEMAVTLRRAVLNSLAGDAPREGVFTARTLFDEAQALTPASLGESRLKLAPSGSLFTPQWLILDLSTTHWTVKDRPAHLEVSVGEKSATLPLPGAASRLAVYLPPLTGALSGGASWPEITLALSGGAPGAGLECFRAVLSGQRLATWPQVLGGEALLHLAGEERTLAGLDASGAANMAASAHWLPMGGTNLPENAAPVRFVRNPWLEVEALLLADASGPRLSSLGREAQAPKPGAAGGMAKAAKWLAGLIVVAAGLAAWRVARRAGAASACGVKLAGLAAWLRADEPAQAGGARVWLWSGLLGLALACGFVLGPEVLRAVALLGTVLAVPLWRSCRPWLASKAPGLAKSATLHYCTGFLAAAVLATILRLPGAAPLSELLGLCGLWLFLAALASQTPCSPTECD